MSLKDVSLAVGVVIALFVGFVGLGQEEKVIEHVVQQNLGASPGPDKYERHFFYDGLETGGKYTSISTTTASYTLSAGEYKSGVVDFETMTYAAALTATLPASTTGAYPTKPGMWSELVIKNSRTAAATTTTIAAGTGVDLQEPDGQNVVIGINNYALIKCVRLDTSDVACVVDETIPAD